MNVKETANPNDIIDTNAHIAYWLDKYVPQENQRLMRLIVLASLASWWQYLRVDSAKVSDYNYYMYVMLPAEKLWANGGENVIKVDNDNMRRIPVPPLSSVVAPVLMVNAHKLMTREFNNLPEEHAITLENSCIDPVITALHTLMGGVGISSAIEGLLVMLDEIRNEK